MAIFQDAEHARHNARIYASNYELAVELLDVIAIAALDGAEPEDTLKRANVVAAAIVSKMETDSGQEATLGEIKTIRSEIVDVILPELVEEKARELSLKYVELYAKIVSMRKVTREDCESVASVETDENERTAALRLCFQVSNAIAKSTRHIFTTVFQETISEKIAEYGIK